jgi:hypothetical protein
LEEIMANESMPEIIEGLPNISGWEDDVARAARAKGPFYLDRTGLPHPGVRAAFGIALHMHQPLILEDGDLDRAPIVSNLQYMMDRQHVHGNHDAPAFAWCYSRTADFIRELVDAGRKPRIMLDYSGTLLYGLRQMGRGDILDNLKSVTLDDRYWPFVEWLGTLWGHAVVPSTPVPDIQLHIRAWQQGFASIFGLPALERVRGFSPPEMQLPNHPDQAFEYVKALKESGYTWMLVQEHTVEETDGAGLRERYLPRKLVTRNAKGEEVSITALIKTQGSDTKLVGHMQPVSEARSLSPRRIGDREVPGYVVQISDGENGGVMMNEFPDHFKRVWHELSDGIVGMNGTEYLEFLASLGHQPDAFSPIQPLHQHAIWTRVGKSPTPQSVEKAIQEAKQSVPRFHMEGGSWTNNLSWVRGYGDVLDPMNRLSAEFHRILDHAPVQKRSHPYRKALFHLLVSETSCYRYWGQGRWTDYAKEICRRGDAILKHDLAHA